MANVKELFEIVKANRGLLREIGDTLKAAMDSEATPQQITTFRNLVEQVRREIIESELKAVLDEGGGADPATRKRMAEENLVIIREAKMMPRLSQGDIALLDAREASLGIAIASSSFENMHPLGQLLSNEEWEELTKHYEEAVKDLTTRKKAKAFLDATVKLAILTAKVASKL